MQVRKSDIPLLYCTYMRARTKVEIRNTKYKIRFNLSFFTEISRQNRDSEGGLMCKQSHIYFNTVYNTVWML